MGKQSAHTVKSLHEKRAARRANNLPLTLIIAGAALVVIALVVLSTNGASASINVSRVKIGSPLGNFTLTDINGKTVRLSDYAGKPVLLNAWATWCPPCKAEMPLLNQYYQAHKNTGFVILAVNAGDPQANAADFANQNGLSFLILLDPSTRLLDALGISDFPTSILIGKDGIVKTIHVGMFTQQTLDAEITPLIQ